MAKIISPTDRVQAVNGKTMMWLAVGVLMALKVYPADRAIMAHRPGVPAVTLAGDNVLDCGDALPGFRLTLIEIFDR